MIDVEFYHVKTIRKTIRKQYEVGIDSYVVNGMINGMTRHEAAVIRFVVHSEENDTKNDMKTT